MDFTQICCLCLRQLKDNISINNIKKQFCPLSYLERVGLCISKEFQTLIAENIPDAKICLTCRDYLSRTYRLHNTCMNTLRLLKRYFNKTNEYENTNFDLNIVGTNNKLFDDIFIKEELDDSFLELSNQLYKFDTSDIPLKYDNESNDSNDFELFYSESSDLNETDNNNITTDGDISRKQDYSEPLILGIKQEVISPIKILEPSQINSNAIEKINKRKRRTIQNIKTSHSIVKDYEINLFIKKTLPEKILENLFQKNRDSIKNLKLKKTRKRKRNSSVSSEKKLNKTNNFGKKFRVKIMPNKRLKNFTKKFADIVPLPNETI